MASSSSTMKLSLTLVLLLSGIVVLGEIGGATAAARCAVVCIQGGYITCKNYPGKKLDGCDCECAPKNGEDCVLHLETGSSFNCTATK